MTEEAELAALRDKCTRFFHGHGRQTAASMLATIPPETAVDIYGQGGVVADLEAEISRLLGKAGRGVRALRGDGAASRLAGAC